MTSIRCRMCLNVLLIALQLLLTHVIELLALGQWLDFTRRAGCRRHVSCRSGFTGKGRVDYLVVTEDEKFSISNCNKAKQYLYS